MVGGEDYRTIGWYVAEPDHLDALEEDGKYGMEEHLDGKIQQVLHLRDEHIQHQADAQDGNVPGGNLGEHVQENLDRVDGIDGQEQHDEENCQLRPGKVELRHQPVIYGGVIRHDG